MVYPELGIGLLVFSILGLLIQMLCALYHFLWNWYSEIEFFVDGFEIVGITFTETIFEIFGYIFRLLDRLWDIVCVITWILTANFCPPLARAYIIVYHSEHADRITEIIAEAITTCCSLFWFHLRGDTL